MPKGQAGKNGWRGMHIPCATRSQWISRPGLAFDMALTVVLKRRANLYKVSPGLM
jgi:hypothetical protein